MNLLKIQIGPFEARGSMVYTEDKGPGTAQLVCECRSVDEAKLFARSPDLLEALRHIARQSVIDDEKLAEKDGWTYKQAFEFMRGEARKAIGGLKGENVS